ncbi:MAG: TatD family deoxyribonuclease [Legionellaceae bacterium]|nr:TatD family deoxyribonuclease [Legionellaceae bacterium]
MLIYSHCHLHLLKLDEFNNDLNKVLEQARLNQVSSLLSVSVDLTDYPLLIEIAKQHAVVKISVGLHPTSYIESEPDCAKLVELAGQHESCIAIGETGLDYYHIKTPEAQKQQQMRFRQHIRAAIKTQKPLIIHTRNAAHDTLAILKEEKAEEIGGVIHCFTEDLTFAKKAIDYNFYISFSGIITFKNADNLREVIKNIPLNRILIETDAPFLAPVPYRGKQNQPAYVKYVAEAVAKLCNVSFEEVCQRTAENFRRCFNLKLN